MSLGNQQNALPSPLDLSGTYSPPLIFVSGHSPPLALMYSIFSAGFEKKRSYEEFSRLPQSLNWVTIKAISLCISIPLMACQLHKESSFSYELLPRFSKHIRLSVNNDTQRHSSTRCRIQQIKSMYAPAALKAAPPAGCEYNPTNAALVSSEYNATKIKLIFIISHFG